MPTPAIRFNCGHWGRSIKVPASRAGKLGFCPGCKGPITVPELTEQPTRTRSRPAPPRADELVLIDDPISHTEPETADDNTYALAGSDEGSSDLDTYEVNEVDEPTEGGDDWLSQLPAAVSEADRTRQMTSSFTGKSGKASKPKRAKLQKIKSHLPRHLQLTGGYARCLSLSYCVSSQARPSHCYQSSGSAGEAEPCRAQSSAQAYFTSQH